MANDLRQKVIDLYAANDVDQLEASPDAFKQALGRNYEQIVKTDEYQYLKQAIKVEKEALETLAAEYRADHGVPLGSAQAQLVACLRFLLLRAIFNTDDKTRYLDKMAILHDLIIARYGGNWSQPPSLRGHFDFLYPKIRDWHLFFFSYANDDQEIQSIGVDLATAFWRTNSQLAELIVQNLRRNNLRKLFYDKRDVHTGTRLDTIFDACAESFFFIQLISRDSLVFNDENWSYEEYIKFKEVNKKLQADHPDYLGILEQRFLFAVPADLGDPAPGGFLPAGYKEWLGHIKEETHHKELPNDVATFEHAVRDIAMSVRGFLEGDEGWISSIPP